MFSCEYCKIFESTYFEEHLQTTASELSHSNIFFNNVPVPQADYQKDFGLTLDSKLIFDMHIKSVVAKVNKTLHLIRIF